MNRDVELCTTATTLRVSSDKGARHGWALATALAEARSDAHPILVPYDVLYDVPSY